MKLKLETSRLILREYLPSDLPSIHQYASQPIVVQYQNWGPNSLQDTQRFLQQVGQNRLVAPRIDYELCVERKEDNQLVGGCELVINSEDDSVATIGYTLNPGCV